VNALPLHRPGDAQAYAWSWAASLLVHGLAIGAAVVLVSGLRLAPQPEPFRWVVSKIEPHVSADVAGLAQPIRPAPDRHAAKPLSAETHAAERTAAPLPPTQAVAQRETPASIPPPQTLPQTIQTPAKPVESIQPLIQTAPTGEAPPRKEAVPTEPAASSATQPVTQAAPPALANAAAASSQAVAESQATPAVQEPARVASLAPVPQPAPQAQSGQAVQGKVDYGWLAGAIRTRVEQLKHYPHIARANRWEGRVVLRAVIGEDGQLVDLKVAESSGHSVLDEAALEVLKKAAPLTLPQPLGRPQVVVQVPISYRLR
jgi:periplasmic protein TonB